MTKLSLFLVIALCGIVAVSCGKYDHCLCNVMNTGQRIRVPVELLPPQFATLNGQNVQLARHHIIPWNVLRAFSGTAIRYATNPNLRSYADSIIRNLMDHFSSVNTFNRRLGTAPHRSNTAQEVSSLLHAYFIWMPGNIFYGPPSSMRSDDPGNGIDSHAIYIVGAEHFALLTRLRDLMVKFTEDATFQTSDNLIEIVTILLKVSTMEPFNYNEDQWDLISGRCRIKEIDCVNPTPPPRDDLRKRSVGNDLQIVREFCSGTLGEYVKNDDYVSSLQRQLRRISPSRNRIVRIFNPLSEYCLASLTCKYMEDEMTALMVES